MALSADLSNGLNGEFVGSTSASLLDVFSFVADAADAVDAVAAARFTEREAGLLTGGLCCNSSFLTSSILLEPFVRFLYKFPSADC